jgi:hypothetical protein
VAQDILPANQLKSDARKSFDNGYQFAWDSTSLGALKTCPRKYLYQIILGFSPRSMSFHLRFGILYHKALENYDKITGTHDERVIKSILSIAPDLCEPDGSCWDTGDTGKSVPNLIRSIIWYLDHFRNDAAKTIILANGQPAVELSFRFNLTTDILLCGHLDRVVEFGLQTWVMDRKTTKGALGSYYMAQFNPNNQMTLYSAASRIVLNQAARGVIIDAAQILVSETRFARGFTERSDEDIEEFFTETKFYLNQAQHFTETKLWPKNDQACGNYGGCAFREVCSAPPRMRETILRSNFVSNFWDPLETRE